MKTFNFYIIIGLLAALSCKTDENGESEKVSCEIYEIVPGNMVPKNMLAELKQVNVILNADTLSPITAYVNIDSIKYLPMIENDNAKFLFTAQPVDKDNRYIAIIAVAKQSGLNNTDIKKTKPSKNNIEIYFNLHGSQKWAGFTKRNIGKLIAFAIDNKIYSLTIINDEIRNGMAIINGFKNDSVASVISNSIVKGL